MLYRDILKQLNLGMLIKGFRIESCGTEQEIASRAALLDKYTGTLTYKDALIGIKPISIQEHDMLTIHWDFSILSRKEDKFVRIAPCSDARLMNQFVFAPDNDVDALLSSLGFVAVGS